jgi:hypothetical protein
VEDVKHIMKKKEDQIKRLLGVLLRLMVDLETLWLDITCIRIRN